MTFLLPSTVIGETDQLLLSLPCDLYKMNMSIKDSTPRCLKMSGLATEEMLTNMPLTEAQPFNFEVLKIKTLFSSDCCAASQYSGCK